MCATEVWLRDGEVYGKKQLRACFESLVSGARYPNLFELELDHIYVLAKVCWSPSIQDQSIANLLDQDIAQVQELLNDLITFDICEYDGISAYLPTDAGEQFIVDLGIEILLTERTQTLPGLQKSIRWVEDLQGLKTFRV